MTRETYQESLSELRSDVLAMGDLVLARLDDALTSLETGDDELARAVVEGDDEINETYLSLEDRCVDLFALQQPVAGDLRLVTASFKVITDLERVGDLATNLAGRAATAVGWPDLDVGTVAIGRDAMTLLERSLDAYETGDVAACRAVAADDDEIDALCERAGDLVARELIEHEVAGDDPFAVEHLMDDVSRVLLTIRDVERIGDHAVNVAARTLYMAENDPALIY